jgi:hypothetical protein
VGGDAPWPWARVPPQVAPCPLGAGAAAPRALLLSSSRPKQQLPAHTHPQSTPAPTHVVVGLGPGQLLGGIALQVHLGATGEEGKGGAGSRCCSGSMQRRRRLWRAIGGGSVCGKRLCCSALQGCAAPVAPAPAPTSRSCPRRRCAPAAGRGISAGCALPEPGRRQPRPRQAARRGAGARAGSGARTAPRRAARGARS